MSTTLTLLSILAALVFLSGLVVTAIGLLRAPEGYEDESGFHRLRVAQVPVAPGGLKEDAQTGHVGLAA